MKTLISKTVLLVTVGFAFSAAALPVPRLSARGAIKHRVSFDETLERYSSPYGFLEEIRNISQSDAGVCSTLDNSVRPIVGTNDPLQGQALEKEPGAFFAKKFADCLRSAIFYSAGSDLPFVSKILGVDLAADLLNEFKRHQSGFDEKLASCESMRTRFASFCQADAEQDLKTYEDRNKDLKIDGYLLTSNGLWEALSPETRLRIVRRFVNFLIGPEVILRNFKYLGPDNVFGAKIDSEDELGKFLLEQVVLPNLKDERIEGATQTISESRYLGLTRAYFEIAVLLRLGPALKH